MGFIRTLDENSTVSPGAQYLTKYAKQRVKNNKNFLVGFVGPTGSGKSYGALSLAYLITDGKIERKNLCFSAEQFMSRLNSGELKKGDVLIWDESGVGMNAKQFMSLANRLMNFVFQTFRHKNLIVLFTLPYLSFLDSDTRKLLHCTMETAGVEKKKGISRFKPKLIQVNATSGKAYHKYLRVSNGRGSVTPVKSVSFKLLPDKELLQFYEDEKTKFTSDLNRTIEADLHKMKKKKEKEMKEDPKEEMKKKVQDALMLLSKGLNQYEVADIVGLAQGTISQYKNRLENTEKYKNIAKEMEVLPS